MMVNTPAFAAFFAVVFAVYYLPAVSKSHRAQSLWLLLTSYAFYALAQWKMLLLLIAATALFYGLGRWLQRLVDTGRAKAASGVTVLGVSLGVGVLLWFKYFDFFASSIASLLSLAGLKATWTALNLVVPLGVSFFTFRLISYIIEIHREHVQASTDPVEFAAYVAFFPSLLSGPIDRPECFLPQLRVAHRFDRALAVDGCRQVLWGMFMKMCVADVVVRLTDRMWAAPGEQSTTMLLAAMILYPMQLYADFSGYSHMAIGVGKVLGFEMARNFNYPFLARNVAEFWRNWHISLTSWITDYVFMPLNVAFRDRGKAGMALAVIINLVLIGFWHGADWTYGLFGLYFGLLYIPLIASGSFGKRKKLRPGWKGCPKGIDFAKMVLNYLVVAVGMLLFRGQSLAEVGEYLRGLFTGGWAVSDFGIHPFCYVAMVLILVLSWTQRGTEHPLQLKPSRWWNHRAARWALYYVIILCIFKFKGEAHQFIYFQF